MGPEPRDAGSPPNVLVILTDDQGWADFGPHNPAVVTPHLDALAAGLWGPKSAQPWSSVRMTRTLGGGLASRGSGPMGPAQAPREVSRTSRRVPWGRDDVGLDGLGSAGEVPGVIAAA